MNGSGTLTVRLGLGLLALAALPLPPAAQERVRLLDGSVLHGRMHSLSTTEGLVWEHPDAETLIRLPFASLSSVRFSSRSAWKENHLSQCRFRFAGGDEIYGTLVALDEQQLELETRFGGPLRTPRDRVRSLTLLQNGHRVLYEGPNSLEEWVRGRSPNDWTYWDGVLCAENRGIIGRQMGLENSASLSFDLEWKETFYLTVIMHTEAVDRHDYRSGGYLFSLRPGSVSLQRIQPGAGTVLLGTENLETMTEHRRARIELRTHRETSTFAMLVDGQLVASWQDARGFVASGGGVVFSLWGSNTGSKVALSHLLLTEWDGTLETTFEDLDPERSDGLLLVNRDQPSGRVRDIREGRLNFHLRERTEVAIPLQRIRQIRLRTEEEPVEDFTEREIRVHFSGGGTFSVELDAWDDGRIRGRSRTFGPVTLETRHIRQVEINLHRGMSQGNAADPLFPFPEPE